MYFTFVGKYIPTLAIDPVIPAKAGIQELPIVLWIPAFAGMTKSRSRAAINDPEKSTYKHESHP